MPPVSWSCPRFVHGLLDELALRADAARVAVVREAADRGETGPGRTGVHAWVLHWSTSLRAGGSARVVRVAEAALDDRFAGLLAAVTDARVPLPTATVVVEEFERLSHRLAPGAEGPVIDGLVEVASLGRPKDVRAWGTSSWVHRAVAPSLLADAR
ncbi:hypothetical protein [Nostocoides sp. HKS02]|uniref:hypothetical protein n=1 Tax=Nostocoides sp. HKS02 TaxID=1813880 RepID=UPI0012B452CC|nr:hypothetical protein [Tetrasphaera sp. HKS02]QGN56784.1 hypothetical protein GKE56_01425 [Tetrasphaera sp. HKS02]